MKHRIRVGSYDYKLMIGNPYLFRLRMSQREYNLRLSRMIEGIPYCKDPNTGITKYIKAS